MDPDRRAAIARGMQAATIDATILRELLIEAHEDADRRYQEAAPARYQVSTAIAMLALRDRSRVVHYHRPECRQLAADVECIQVDIQQIKLRRYQPCQVCETLSQTAWCEQLGIEPTLVSKIITKAKLRVRKRTAITLFRALGEKPHPAIVAWVQEQSRRRGQLREAV